MSTSNAAQVADFVKECLDAWYGKGNVFRCTATYDKFVYSFRVEACFVVHVEESGDMTLITSRGLGPVLSWSSLFLDKLVDAAEKQFPDMPQRMAAGSDNDTESDSDWSWGPDDCAQP